MERIINVTGKSFYVPVKLGSEERLVEFFALKKSGERVKIYEFKIPVDLNNHDNYNPDYYVCLPVGCAKAASLIVSCDAGSLFLETVTFDKPEEKGKPERRPAIHLTTEHGWSNDPNGLVYDEGIYHFYYQYNPFNIVWGNMSWGHAVSEDLLHWKQEPAVLYPDKDGTMYSGSAILNDRNLLNVPRDAIIYFYTSASVSEWSKGSSFDQRIAISRDHGATLQKTDIICLPELASENRDPKVFWHNESGAYIMVLFLSGNDFAICRSEDLVKWEETDRFTLAGTWECPDLFYLTDGEGNGSWFFWTADGFCYPGDFDGYHFTFKGKMQKAYINPLPYAAQTYSNTDGRVISVPWLRMNNDGRHFTGAYGIPTEMTCRKEDDGYVLIQQPVKELWENADMIRDGIPSSTQKQISHFSGNAEKAVIIELTGNNTQGTVYNWLVNNCRVSYDPFYGILNVDGKKTSMGKDYSRFCLIIDDRIMEIFFDGGKQFASYELQTSNVSFETSCDMYSQYAVYEVD